MDHRMDLSDMGGHKMWQNACGNEFVEGDNGSNRHRHSNNCLPPHCPRTKFRIP